MPDTLQLPRLLCLHGGGVNAAIFRRQCRTLIRALAPFYHLVFADAPYICNVGPGVESVYGDSGPFRRWLRWLPEHPPVDDADAVRNIEACMRRAMEADDAEGGCGDWVGLVGFSQGAKVAASVLFEMQTRRELARREPSEARSGPVAKTQSELCCFAGGNWRFGVLLAGRGSLVALSDATYGDDALELPGGLAEPPRLGEKAQNPQRLRMPTVHVHGLSDPGLDHHRALLEDFTSRASGELVEWNGDHRVPFKTADVDKIVAATLKVAKKAEMQDYMSRRNKAADSVSLLHHAGKEPLPAEPLAPR